MGHLIDTQGGSKARAYQESKKLEAKPEAIDVEAEVVEVEEDDG